MIKVSSGTKVKEFLENYKSADPEERAGMMMDNYLIFPKLIKRAESKTRYLIKSEREYRRSHSRGELGVRVKSSNLSDPTFEEAALNLLIDQSFETGKIEKGIIDGLEGDEEYEETIHIISVMWADYKMLNEIIDNCEEEDVRLLKKYLMENKVYRVIAEEEDCSYDSVKRKITKIREEIREEMIECLEDRAKRTTGRETK